MMWPAPYFEDRLVWETGRPARRRSTHHPVYRYIVWPDRLARGTDHLAVALHDAGYGVLQQRKHTSRWVPPEQVRGKEVTWNCPSNG